MPSDNRREEALRAVAGPLDTFHSALAGAVEDVRTFLRTHEESGERREDNERAELGAFAASRIDVQRFSALVARRSTADSSTVTGMRRAHSALAAIAAAGNAPFQVSVTPGVDVQSEVSGTLSRMGRAFGAARVAGYARDGSYDPERHDALLKDLPFRSWSPSERRLAPPLVVEADGADLAVQGLAQVLDGQMKVVLVVRGDAPPALLAHLITPGVYVAQVEKAQDLAPFAAFDGPGIAALVGPDAALFTHDPTRGGRAWDRLDVSRVPEGEPKAALGGTSRAQQAEQLRHLAELASPPPASAAPASAPTLESGNGDGGSVESATPATASPVDKLAAWLLGQAEDAA